MDGFLGTDFCVDVQPRKAIYRLNVGRQGKIIYEVTPIIVEKWGYNIEYTYIYIYITYRKMWDIMQEIGAFVRASRFWFHWKLIYTWGF